jgi:hypothetical protein
MSSTYIDVTADCPTVPEIIAAIRKMPSEAAGVDGIPTDLFIPYTPQQTEELDSETAAADTVHASQFPSQSNSVAHIAAALHTVFKASVRQHLFPQKGARQCSPPLTRARVTWKMCPATAHCPSPLLLVASGVASSTTSCYLPPQTRAFCQM